MKKKTQIVVSCILAVAALAVIYSFLNSQGMTRGEEVFIFAKEYPAGTLIEPDMIQSINLSSASSLHGYASKDLAVGKYTTRDVYGGEIVLSEVLSNYPKKIQNYEIAPGNVLYTLSLRPEDANGWWIYTGSYVDVLLYSQKNLASFTTEIYEFENFTGSIESIDDVKIIKVMDMYGKDIEESENDAYIICLEMSREQAAKMFIAENSRKIKIIPGLK